MVRILALCSEQFGLKVIDIKGDPRNMLYLSIIETYIYIYIYICIFALR